VPAGQLDAISALLDREDLNTSQVGIVHGDVMSPLFFALAEAHRAHMENVTEIVSLPLARRLVAHNLTDVNRGLELGNGVQATPLSLALVMTGEGVDGAAELANAMLARPDLDVNAASPIPGDPELPPICPLAVFLAASHKGKGDILLTARSLLHRPDLKLPDAINLGSGILHKDEFSISPLLLAVKAFFEHSDMPRKEILWVLAAKGARFDKADKPTDDEKALVDHLLEAQEKSALAQRAATSPTADGNAPVEEGSRKSDEDQSDSDAVDEPVHNDKEEL
jgi:hypothetical protein